MTEFPIEDQHEQHEIRHHRLVDEIASQVEQRLVAKFTRWLAVNFLVILAMLASVIGTYYALDNRITENKKLDELQDRLIDTIIKDDAAMRNDLLTEIRELKKGQDEINRFLRDHNSMTMNRLDASPRK